MAERKTKAKSAPTSLNKRPQEGGVQNAEEVKGAEGHQIVLHVQKADRENTTIVARPTN